MFSNLTYKLLGSPNPIFLSGRTPRSQHLEFVVFNVNLLRYGRTDWKVTLLNYHRCVIDAADGAREVCGAFELELCFTIPAMDTSNAHLSKSKRLLPSFLWDCVEEKSMSDRGIKRCLNTFKCILTTDFIRISAK